MNYYMKQKSLCLAVLLVFSCAINLSAQKPVEVQLAKSKLSGNVSKVVEGRLYEYEEWGETKYKMDTLKVSWYDISGRKVLSMGKNVVSLFSYRPDGKIESISYSPRNSRSGDCFGKLEYLLPVVSSDVYTYSSDGRLLSIVLNNPVDENGYKQTGMRSSLYYDQCIEVPYECEAEVLDECYAYERTARIVFKYESDGSYHSIMCDENGATIKKTGISSNGRLVVNNWGLCEYDASGRLLSWGGEVKANNGVAKWSYLLGYDKKGNLAIQTGKEDLVKDIDAVPWLKEAANYYGATVFEYKFDARDNWTECTEYEILYNGKKSKKKMWGRIIEYGNYLDIESLKQSGKNLAEKNKAAAAQYVINCFRNRFLDDADLNTTNWDGVPLYDIEKITASYKQYQKAVQDYLKNSEVLSSKEKKAKYKEIQTLGSDVYALAGIDPDSRNANSRWYQWLAVIWSECIESEDEIPSNVYVALDAVEKISEINGKRSSIVWDAMMYFYFYLLDDNDLSLKGLTKGKTYKAHGAGLEMETKVWSRDMLLTLADSDFSREFIFKIQDFEREFKANNNLRDDYLPQ